MDYNSYFRIEVEEIVWTADGAKKTTEELKHYGRPFVFFRVMSLPIDILRTCIIEEVSIDDDVYAKRLFDLGMIEHNLTCLRFPNGNTMILNCYYYEFVKLLDDLMNKDTDNFGLTSYSFKTGKYGHKNR